MTDIYIRRSDQPGRRGRAFLIPAIVVVVVIVAGFLIRSGCAPGFDRDQVARTVNEDPLIDELIGGAVGTDSPEADSAQAPPDTDKEGPRPAPRGPDAGPQLLVRAKALHRQGSIEEAGRVAANVLDASRNAEARAGARDLIGTVNIARLTTPREMTEKVEYTVQSGDSLAKLAKKFGTTVELIQKSNNVSGSIIRVGDRMRIFTGKFEIQIDKSDNLLDLHMNGDFFKRYRVGTGEYSRTPVGEFKVTDRIAQPTWWRSDGKAIPYGSPDNELGTHWLSLDVRGYGIHGTWEPDTIGQQSSAGCIRLLNENIEELYALIPVGTPVTIQD